MQSFPLSAPYSRSLDRVMNDDAISGTNNFNGHLREFLNNRVWARDSNTDDLGDPSNSSDPTHHGHYFDLSEFEIPSDQRSLGSTSSWKRGFQESLPQE